MSGSSLDILMAERAIRRLLALYCDAVSRKDAEAIRPLFAPGAAGGRAGNGLTRSPPSPATPVQFAFKLRKFRNSIGNLVRKIWVAWGSHAHRRLEDIKVERFGAGHIAHLASRRLPP